MGPQKKHRTRWREEVSSLSCRSHRSFWQISCLKLALILHVGRLKVLFELLISLDQMPLKPHRSLQLWLQEKLNKKFWSIYCKLLLKTVLEIASFRCKYIFSDQLFGFSEHGTSVFSKDRISFSARRILSSNSSPFRCSSSFSWAAWICWTQICWWADEKWIILSPQVPCEDS